MRPVAEGRSFDLGEDEVLGGSISGITAIAIGSLTLLAFPATTSADQGGMTIASAPEVPLGRIVVSTVPPSATLGSICATQGKSGEFWRVTMNTFDHLTVDFSSTNGDAVGVNIIAPTVNDSNAANAETTGGCLDLVTTSSTGQLRFEAAGAGRYTLLFTDRQGSNGVAYQMTAHVVHYTHLTITAPTRVKARALVTFAGRVTGATGGTLNLRLRAGSGPWKALTAILAATGSFSFKARVAGPGLYHINAHYPGDDLHLPSSATLTFKVTR